MSTYWTLAHVNEHPAKTRQINHLEAPLPDHACQGFRTKLELAKSRYFGRVIIAEEDPAPIYEVVLFVGDVSTERREGHGVEGIFVDCMQIEERKPLLDWLRELSTSSNADEAKEGEKILLDYEDVRDLDD